MLLLAECSWYFGTGQGRIHYIVGIFDDRTLAQKACIEDCAQGTSAPLIWNEKGTTAQAGYCEPEFRHYYDLQEFELNKLRIS